MLFDFGQLANRGELAEIGLIYLNLALYLSPNHEFALLTLADLQETIGQHDEAIAAYKRIPQTFRLQRRHRHSHRRQSRAMADRTSEAEAKLRELIVRQSEGRRRDHRARQTSASAEVLCRGRQGLHTGGRRDRASRRSPTGRSIFARGVAYDAAKNWKHAEPDLVQAGSKLDPEQPVVLNYLGYSWVDRAVDSGERSWISSARRSTLRPNDGDIVDSLGWAYYRRPSYDDATEELERAVELKPQSWEINDHLGDVYWKTDRKLEAKFQWLHALTLEIDDDKRGLIERKITEGLEPVEAGDRGQEGRRACPATAAGCTAPKTDDRAEATPASLPKPN